MGSEFADYQKRPEKQQDPHTHDYAPKPQTKLAKPGKPPVRLAATYPEQRRVMDPENPGQYKIEGWTPETQARYDDNPELAWLKDPDGKPPTPQEAVLMRKAKKRQQEQELPSQIPKPAGTEKNGVSDSKPKAIGKKETLIAQLDGSGIQEDPVTNLFKVVVGGVIVGTFENLKAASDYLGQYTPDLGKEVFGHPAGPDESKFINKGAVLKRPSAPASTPKGTAPQPMPSVAPMPTESVVEPLREVKPSAFEQEQLRQQQQWKQEQQQQADQLQAQQTAQTKLSAKQEKLSDFSAKLFQQQKPMEDFEAQLTPPQKEALTKAVKARYQDLAALAQQADNPLQKYEVADLQKAIRQQVLYERFVPVREIYHFGNQFLNGYTPQKMKAVRGYFDQVFDGSYSKSIPADKRAAIIQSADARYTQETGKKPNRESSLWKTYRNVEASEKFPDLWDGFRDDLSKAPSQPMGIMTGASVPPLGGFGEGAGIASELLKPETFPSGGATLPPLGGFDMGQSRPGLIQPETFPTNQKVDGVTNVFEYTTDYRKNYEQFYGAIPAGTQIHHIAPRAVFNNSPLAQEWVGRGITKLDYPENLEALPQTKDAYDQSGIKIQHSGSHEIWSRHASEVLDQTQRDLVRKYGSLDKVPDDVMETTKNKIMKKLRNDLLDKDLGLEEGWVVPKDSGMDKLSQSQQTDQIG